MLQKIALISFILCCFACKNGKIRKLYYPGGKIKEIDSILNDSIIVGTSYFFYENGQLNRKEVYDSSGNLNGTSQIFWGNGSYFQSINYINGLAQGESVAYDSIVGHLYFKEFFFDDKVVGDNYNYTDNKVESYRFYNFNGELAMLQEYDNNGNIKNNKRGGRIFFYKIKSTRLKLDSNLFTLYILQSNPLRSSNKLTARYLDAIGKQLGYDSFVTTGQHLIELKKRMPFNLKYIEFTDIQYDSTQKKEYKDNYDITVLADTAVQKK